MITGRPPLLKLISALLIAVVAFSAQAWASHVDWPAADGGAEGDGGEAGAGDAATATAAAETGEEDGKEEGAAAAEAADGDAKPAAKGKRRKIKKKASATSALKTATSKTSASAFDASELKFFAEERPRLIAQGIHDPVRQNAELQRRYKEIQALKKGTSPTKATTPKATTPKATIIPSATPFSAVQMKQLGLTLVGVETDVLVVAHAVECPILSLVGV